MPQPAPTQPGTAPTRPGTATVRSRVRIPLTFPDGYRAEAEVFTFHGLADGAEHLALAFGTSASTTPEDATPASTTPTSTTPASTTPASTTPEGATPENGTPQGRTPLVRLHSECLTGDVFGSDRCDCGPQLRESVERIAEAGGYLLYLRQEGRGIGLYNKLDAYALQDSGLDTYDANTALGLPEDGRDYTAAAQMLTALGATGIDLLSNNPDKAAQLAGLGITVEHRVPTGVHLSASNIRYLRAKVERTGHSIELSRLVG
ncbi:GTP cyclohydrolase II [Kitasatospora sp. NPDC059327]|uniref:GTP cyclohydrolase II n=1 Tax=Kitasatospora sp. NPDC059327 TaxID=3346803 RepID=UPI0036A59FDF